MADLKKSRLSNNVIDVRDSEKKKKYVAQSKFDLNNKMNPNLYEKERVKNWGNNDPSVPNPADVGRDAVRVGMASDIGRRIYNEKKDPPPQTFKKNKNGDSEFLPVKTIKTR